MIRLYFAFGLLALVLIFLRSARVFRVVFLKGTLVDYRGKAALPVLQVFKEIAGRRHVSGGVSVFAGGYLRFSRSIAEADRQRFRNVFVSTPRD